MTAAILKFTITPPVIDHGYGDGGGPPGDEFAASIVRAIVNAADQGARFTRQVADLLVEMHKTSQATQMLVNDELAAKNRLLEEQLARAEASLDALQQFVATTADMSVCWPVLVERMDAVEGAIAKPLPGNGSGADGVPH
jgi:hypothetical protein